MSSPPKTSSQRHPLQPVKPYGRGYTSPRTETFRAMIFAAHRTQLWRSLMTAIGDHATIVGVGLTARAAIRSMDVLPAVCGYLLALVVIARCLRGLECLGHEAAHWNWSRGSKRLNDVFGNLLAAAPVFGRVSSYRASHLLHHTRFGTMHDPDLQRYRELDLESLDRTSTSTFAVGLMTRLPGYIASWWSAIGTSGTTVVSAVAWHAVYLMLLMWVLGATDAVFISATWLTSLALVLPVIRLIGEASEHNYIGTQTIFEATITNAGILQRLLIHPHGDGWHLIHHLWMGVPHHQLRRLHRRLAKLDPENFRVRARIRTKILQQA